MSQLLEWENFLKGDQVVRQRAVLSVFGVICALGKFICKYEGGTFILQVHLVLCAYTLLLVFCLFFTFMEAMLFGFFSGVKTSLIIITEMDLFLNFYILLLNWYWEQMRYNYPLFPIKCEAFSASLFFFNFYCG